VDDLRFGSIVRAVRHRRGLRQSDLAQLAGLSQQTVSDLERGRVDSLRVIRKIARALEIRVSLAPEWRGGDFDRLTDSRHAALVEVGIAALRNAGWEATAEFTFNRYGERGAVDILGWQAERRALLIVEVKTSLNNLQELLGKLDRKTRLVPGLVAAERGWRATSVGTVLLVAEQSGMRRPIARHVATFGSTLPARNLEVRRWIAEPRGSLRGIWFQAITAARGTRRVSRTVGRVRSHTGAGEGVGPRSGLPEASSSTAPAGGRSARVPSQYHGRR
jgi:transcriptional regulator with XRE-family HTH domain